LIRFHINQACWNLISGRLFLRPEAIYPIRKIYKAVAQNLCNHTKIKKSPFFTRTKGRFFALYIQRAVYHYPKKSDTLKAVAMLILRNKQIGHLPENFRLAERQSQNQQALHSVATQCRFSKKSYCLLGENSPKTP
jgi:hypothetical protein